MTNHRLLNRHVREVIADADNRILVSAVAVWEIAIKRRANKLNFDGSPVAAIEENQFVAISIQPSDAEVAGDLDWNHKDPFDRLIVAQAVRLGVALATTDGEMRNAPAAVLWAG